MSSDLAQLALFLGATAMGVAALDASHLSDRPAEDSAQAVDQPEALLESYPFVIMCAVHSQYDPATAKGIGGQFAVHESASVSFSLSAYIRELGYRATVRPVDSVAVAVAAQLGTRDMEGRFVPSEHGDKVYVGDGVLTDLPLAVGCPSLR